MKEILRHFLRKFHLIRILDPLRNLLSVFPWFVLNQKFKKKYPDYPLPPGHLAYDAYGGRNWLFYKTSGEGAAKFILHKIKPYIVEKKARILEWGCGPGRIIRNLPKYSPQEWAFYGSDYNGESIGWCKSHFKEITFAKNNLSPPLDFPEEYFNAIYAISVFTHLSEKQYKLWQQELYRLLKPKGVLLFSTQGASTKVSLLESEKKSFKTKGIVSRENFKEGKKSFGTFHNPDFIRNNLGKNFKVAFFQECGMYRMKQDLWVLQKT